MVSERQVRFLASLAFYRMLHVADESVCQSECCALKVGGLVLVELALQHL